ncbi:hypothetical protein SAMN05421858_5062 [Haladaptatus litoreus]|uniref:Uncharacterized protein n=1 Tax=Haladaptatus litoreus TaxID=553468 RepID=A0A1N7FHR5_9EURY|nr:hypothetical protein SAMN05421858_5062 [Haladaptatus litoreus]
MTDACPNCGESLEDTTVYGPGGERATQGIYEHLTVRNGALMLEFGIKCDYCDWENTYLFAPYERR